jgi:hypothetical protein
VLKGLKGPVLLIGGWVLFFGLIQFIVGGVSSMADNQVGVLPDTTGMGLSYAKNVVLKDKKFQIVKAHDSTGRSRSLGGGGDWKVCAQYTPQGGKLVPVAGRVKHNTEIDLGVVLLDEACGPDLTLNRRLDDPLDYAMPDFRGVTPAEVVKAMRKEASLRFYSTDGDEISSQDYNRWRVCTQQLRQGATFFGQPVAFTAVRFDKNDNADPPVPNNLDQLCPDRDWQGVKGFPATRFPALI